MDDLSGMLSGLGGGGTGADPTAALGGLTQAVQQDGGLDGLLGKLRGGGLGPQVDSWVSTGDNQPVDPDQLGRALGPDTVRRLSAGSGLDIGSLLPMLAAFLPQIINMLTPHGKVPDGGLDGAVASGGMPDLGGLLGGLIGGGGGGAGGSTAGTGGLDDMLGGLGGLLGGAKDR